jgi:putative MATE family efflux protein
MLDSDEPPRRPGTPPRRDQGAAHEVESDIEDLGDPEGGPSLPATTLAARGTVTDHSNPGVASSASGSAYREIFRLGWPVMASQVLVSIAGLVDRAMIGRLGGDSGSAVPLAAVGYATQFFFLIQSALFAVGLACVALMARAIGAGDPARSRDALSGSMQVSLATTLGFTFMMLAAPGHMLGLLGAEPDVVTAGLPYLRLIVGSSVLLAVTLTFDSALRANRNTRTPMVIALLVTAIKLALNWVLIFGTLGAPRMGLVGAGLATVASQVVGLVVYLMLFRSIPRSSPIWFSWRSLTRRSAVLSQVIRVAAPGIAERVVLNLGLLSYFWILSRYYGTLAVAAYTVGVPLLSFSWIPGSGYAQSCATVVGQRLGAGNRPGARTAGVQAALLALATALPLGILFGVFRTPLAELFTDDTAVVAALGPFMLALAVGQPFLQLHFTLGGAHRGAGDTWTPLIAATLGNWMFRVPVAWIAAAVFHADVKWVWYALVLDHMARAALMYWSFRRERWMSTLD